MNARTVVTKRHEQDIIDVRDKIAALRIAEEDHPESNLVDPKTLGMKIARARRALNYSQEKFAEKLETGRNTIIDIENGYRYPNMLTLIRFLELTGMTPNQLLCREDDSTDEQRESSLMDGMTETEKQSFLQSAGFLAAGIIAKRKDSLS